MFYSLLRGIFVTIGITPPPPERARTVGIVFFSICALVLVGMVALGVLLLKGM